MTFSDGKLENQSNRVHLHPCDSPLSFIGLKSGGKAGVFKKGCCLALINSLAVYLVRRFPHSPSKFVCIISIQNSWFCY